MKGIFSNSFETSDIAKEENLTTHYYANDYQKTRNTIIDIAKGKGYKVENVDDKFHEILLLLPRGTMIITLFNPQFYLTSVDFKITTAYLIPFGRGAKLIGNYYTELNRQLTLKKVGGTYE